MSDNEQNGLTLKQKEIQVGADIAERYEILFSNDGHKKHRSLIKGVTVDSYGTRLREDGFFYDEVSIGKNQKSSVEEIYNRMSKPGRDRSSESAANYNCFKVVVFFPDITEALIASAVLKNEILNNLTIPIAHEDKIRHFSFDEGKTRLANSVSFVIDKKGTEIKSDIYVRAVLFESEKSYDFEEYTKANKGDETFVQLQKAIRNITKKYLNVDHSDTNEPSKIMFKDLMILSSHLVAKAAGLNDLENFIYRGAAFGNTPEYSFKPLFNAKYGTNYYCDFTKPLSNITAGPNNLAFINAARRIATGNANGGKFKQNIITKEEYQGFLQRVNAGIAEHNTSKRGMVKFLTGNKTVIEDNMYPVIVSKKIDQSLLSSSIHTALVKHEDNVREAIEEGLSVTLKDVYPVILATPAKTNLRRCKEALDTILKNDRFLSEKIFENIIHDHPEEFSAYSAKSFYSKGETGLQSEYSYQLYALCNGGEYKLYTEKRSSSVHSAQRNLLHQVSFRKSAYHNLDNKDNSTDNGSGPSRSFDDIYLKSRNILEKYKDLSLDLDVIGYYQNSYPKKILLDLVKKYDWKLEETRSENNTRKNGAGHKMKIKTRIECDLFPGGKTYTVYGDRNDKATIMGTVYSKMLEEITRCSRVIDDANRIKQGSDITR